jgi:hypothetical protein
VGARALFDRYPATRIDIDGSPPADVDTLEDYDRLVRSHAG